jgi:hypothetical protein
LPETVITLTEGKNVQEKSKRKGIIINKMPFFEKSNEWLHQSSLLLGARPDTVRIYLTPSPPPESLPPAFLSRDKPILEDLKREKEVVLIALFHPAHVPV